MEDRQEEWYATFHKLKRFMTTNAADLNALIAAEKVKLDTLINDIDLQDAIANSDDTGFTQLKENVLVQLTLHAKLVSRALTSYFQEKNDPGNLEKVNMTNTELEYRDDAKLN